MGEIFGGVTLSGKADDRALAATSASQAGIVERQPALVYNKKSGRAAEPGFDSVKKIGKDGGRGGGADQPFRLEALDIGVAQILDFGVEKAMS